jgi:lipopolysaccharide export system permease protein
MLLLAERILSKRVPVIDVLLLIFYSLPGIVAMALPFAALVGSLMAIGKFSSENEIIAFQASGISLKKIFSPIFFIAAVLCVFSFAMNDYFLPLGNLRLNTLYQKLLYSHPELEIESYSVKNFQESILANGLVQGQSVQTLFILDREPEGSKRLIMAESAVIDKTMEGAISLIMKNVVMHSISQTKKEEYSYSFADIMEYNLLLKNISAAFRNPSPREMSSYDVYQEILKKEDAVRSREWENELRQRMAELEYRETQKDLLEKVYTGRMAYENAELTLDRLSSNITALASRQFLDRSLQSFLLEFYKKFSQPLSCIVFVIFAFPVGLFTHRSGRSMGFGIGLFIAIFYWGMLFAGQTLGIRAQFPAFWAMWLPNLIILTLGGFAAVLRFLR